MSTGEKEVWRVVIDDAGDCRLRNFERSFRRNLLGMKSFIVRHGKVMLDLEKTLCGWSFHDITGLSIGTLEVSHETDATETFRAPKEGLFSGMRRRRGGEEEQGR